jgi:hypothetical protein
MEAPFASGLSSDGLQMSYEAVRMRTILLMIGGAMKDVDNVMYAPFSVCLGNGFTFSTIAAGKFPFLCGRIQN